ncbi:oxidoreductase [Cryptosporangium minutisporangium]|uniref:SDR family NAD(P)-dependent oxidoreductase n=1 Tax=Cryptosporangium minutisporangium TaxID=113569 RepID=A0ABP6SRG6_9ACTN
MARWTTADIPAQDGRTAIVTGANSGLGYRTAEALARAGASVVLACRNAEKGADAVRRLKAAVPDAADRVEVRSLDLADLDSVRAFAAATTGLVDLLVNNAGIMTLPTRRTTAQGFEMQFGTNHLGHFALTGLLLPRLLDRPGSRVVTVSSIMHKRGKASQLDDPQSERAYSPAAAYSFSKLANAWFTLELDRRLRAAGAPTISVGAHPGYTATNLQTTGPQADGVTIVARVMAAATTVLGQSDAMGALPSLRAATDPAVQGGEYYGPSGPGELRGHPVRAKYTATGRDQAAARRLWEESERLTEVTIPLTV